MRAVPFVSLSKVICNPLSVSQLLCFLSTSTLYLSIIFLFFCPRKFTRFKTVPFSLSSGKSVFILYILEREGCFSLYNCPYFLPRPSINDLVFFPLVVFFFNLLFLYVVDSPVFHISIFFWFSVPCHLCMRGALRCLILHLLSRPSSIIFALDKRSTFSFKKPHSKSCYF